MIYLMAYIGAVFFAHSARVDKNKKRAICEYIFSGFILVMLATLRGGNVGIDIDVYVQRFYDKALTTQNLFVYLKTFSNEHLYMILTFLAAKLGSIQIVHFLNELVIVTMVYLAIWEEREDIYCDVAVAVFSLVFYGQTLNTVRQNMAMAVVLYGFTQLQKGKRLRFYLLVLLATGFHSSAIIAVALDLLYTVSKLNWAKKVRVVFALLAILASVFYAPLCKTIVSAMSFLPQRYISDKYLFREEYNISSCGLGLWGLAFIASLVYLYQKKKDAEFWFYIQTLCLCSVFVAANALFVNRIFWYFEYTTILFYSKKNFMPISKRIQYVEYGFMVGVMLLYFGILEIFLNIGGIYPYTFFWND